MNKKIDLMEGEHIIFNKKGKPIFTNKTFEAQQRHERSPAIPYNAQVDKEYIAMMSKERKYY